MTAYRPDGPQKPNRWVRWLLNPLPDARDRAEIVADLDALRKSHGTVWYWRELLRYGWSLRMGATHSADTRAGFLESVLWDVRHAIRLLAHTPSLALVAIPTIALAMGASTALFSFADALMLRPLPVREPDRLFSLFHVSTEVSRSYSNFSRPDYVELRDWSQSTSGIAAFSTTEVRIGDDAEAEPVEALIVSGNYFQVLGAPPTVGRGFMPEEDVTSGTHPVVVLSRGLLDRRFGGDVSIVGRSITLNEREFTVIGIAPANTPSIDLTVRPEVWVPLSMHEVVLPGFAAFGTQLFNNRGTHWLDLIARLPSGVAPSAAASELQALARRQAEENPQTNRTWSISVVPAAEARLGPPTDRPLARLTALLAAVLAMVLLIACANVANLLLAQASARHGEMAVRLAIGASRMRLLRQTLTEALLLAGIGGVLGLLVAMACLRLLPLLDLSSDLAGLGVQLDARVVAFASVLTLGTGLLFGLVPALRSSAAAVARAERRTTGSGSSMRPTMRNSLLVAQLALALVLLVGAGLALRTLWNLGRVPLGFDTHNLLLAPLDLAQRRDSTPGDLQIYANILEQTRSLAGVRHATLARISPFSGNRMANDIFWESSAAPGTRERTNVDMNVVDAEYFEALGISILAGRPFARADGPNATAVTIVNRALADRLWPGENPIGKRIWEWRVNQDDRALEVIGVVANGRYYRSWRNSDRPFLFLPLAQNPASEMTLHVRTDGVPSRIGTDLRRIIAQTDPSIPRPMMLTAADAMSAAVSLQRTNARLLTLFGILATVVAMIGVYGVVSFTVSQRTHEIGVRMALGARAADVNRMILAGSARPMLLGSGVGLVVAALLARFLAPLLYGVGARDPATYGTVAVVLIGIGLLATHIPARRATRLDPVAVLRE